MKQLHRSNSNKKLSGVLGGIGEYFNVDPTVVRVGYIIITILTGVVPGLIAYPLLALIIPAQGKAK